MICVLTEGFYEGRIVVCREGENEKEASKIDLNPYKPGPVAILCFPIQHLLIFPSPPLRCTSRCKYLYGGNVIYELRDMSESDVYAVNLICVKSYLYYHKSKYYNKIVLDLLEQTKGKWEEAVRWFVSNSVRASRRNATGLTVSLRAETYSRSSQGIGYRKVKSFLDMLEKGSYINTYKGYVVSWKYVNGKQVPDKSVPSCIVFKERWLAVLRDLDTRYDLWKDLESNDLAIMRNRETKEQMSTKGVTGFNCVKTDVKRFNETLQGADITFNGKPIADVAYRRIFSGNIRSGGRLYSLGGGVQLLPQHIRKSALKIDGESVVELDYSCIHPNICYQIMQNDGFNIKEVLGEDFSPYGADLSFIKVDEKLKEQIEKLTGKIHNPRRELAKLAILIGMNAESMTASAYSLGMKVKEDRDKPIIEQDFYAMVGYQDYGRILSVVQDHNDLIAEQFFNDSGILIQNIDSRIMMNIVGKMGEKGHTVLCYHDSAIVKKSAKQDLLDAMIQAWHDVLGDTTFCRVEEK